MARKLNIAVIVMLLGRWLCAAPPPPPPDVSLDKGGKLLYATDERGDRVPDFSYCGYRTGDVPIPDVPVRVVVALNPGDSTARIQAGIDQVAALKPDENGFCGAVLLEKGRYEVAGSLKITASGVVLRGSGAGDGGTVIVATGQDRRALIQIVGKQDWNSAIPEEIAGKHVPVGATEVPTRTQFKPGDNVFIERRCTVEWIKLLGMDNMGGERHGFGWRPGSRVLRWDRSVTAVHGTSIMLDSPITTAIDANLGGGTVAAYTWPGRISNVGVENLRCESAFDEKNPKDEAHAWFGVTIENAADAWVRQASFAHFAASAVAVMDSCKRVTVEDSKSLAPISEIAGQRRQSFFVGGQQVLVQRCYAEHGRHDFAVGFCAAGPNAFVQCEAKDALGDSGPIDSWASGVLYDNVRIDGNALSLTDRRYQEQGAGWAAANCLLWQCYASVINCSSPPGARNGAIGCWGQFDGNGHWSGERESVRPVSLYYGQLAERVQADIMKRAAIMMTPSDPSSSPTPEVAAQLTAASTKPAPQMFDWIDQAATRHPIPTDAAGANTLQDVVAAVPSPPPQHHIAINENGWIASDEGIVTGRQGIKWWAGGVRPDELKQVQPNITRFVPGRVGPGLTDDLDDLTDDMRDRGHCAIEYHYGLWYDVRDADHERIRRMDGDVWPPFYELPFARSGVGQAWDGLSKYDLTKYNPWYFARLKEFADLGDCKGLVLINQHFFQHNIIEAGAHWASCPWRSANNVNDTGFPEPPPYAGDKRIFMAEQFYDVNNSTRTAIYRAYIRKCLEIAADNANVIHLTSAEFTGPLHFMRFWIDTVAEWEKETGKKPLIGLSATKDVQDAILADSERAKIVNVIDIQYWWYEADGHPYAPPGGKNLAPRQWERVIRHKGASFEQVVRAVREYREKYPDKAVICSGNGLDPFGWAQLFGGGSLANLPGPLDPKLRAAVAKMKPVDPPQGCGATFALGDGKNFVVYSPSSIPTGFTAKSVDVRSGKLSDASSAGRGEVVWLIHL